MAKGLMQKAGLYFLRQESVSGIPIDSKTQDDQSKKFNEYIINLKKAIESLEKQCQAWLESSRNVSLMKYRCYDMTVPLQQSNTRFQVSGDNIKFFSLKNGLFLIVEPDKDLSTFYRIEKRIGKNGKNGEQQINQVCIYR